MNVRGLNEKAVLKWIGATARRPQKLVVERNGEDLFVSNGEIIIRIPTVHLWTLGAILPAQLPDGDAMYRWNGYAWDTINEAILSYHMAHAESTARRPVIDTRLRSVTSIRDGKKVVDVLYNVLTDGRTTYGFIANDSASLFDPTCNISWDTARKPILFRHNDEAVGIVCPLYVDSNTYTRYLAPLPVPEEAVV